VSKPPTGSLEKLRLKISHNLHLGPLGFAKKSVAFVAASARSRYFFRDVNALGVGVKVVGLPPKISNRGGQIRIGDDVIFDAKLTPIYLELVPHAVLTIGPETYINDGVWFGCTGKISVGARVLIGPGVRVFDNSYHGAYDRRVLPSPRPVTIEDDVWIATNSIILAGVTLGRGSIVGANSVVSKDVPPYSIVAGNPARQINELDPRAFELAQQRHAARVPNA
jgi:acetyltransferase-like isoleucine patch superfamily enzyme